jgi:hypothetical protein
MEPPILRRRLLVGAYAVVWLWVLAGGFLVLASFMLDYDNALRGLPPAPFRWGLFGAGIGLASAALARTLFRRT